MIDYRGSFHFDLPPEAMWNALEHSERFEGWWGWLREFRLDGGGLRAGSVLHGLVSPPVPYQMQVDVALDSCTPPEQIDASVRAIWRATARLLLGRWVRHPGRRGLDGGDAQRPMRVAARLASPLLRFGHDRVVEATVNGFRRHLITERGRAPRALVSRV